MNKKLKNQKISESKSLGLESTFSAGITTPSELEKFWEAEVAEVQSKHFATWPELRSELVERVLKKLSLPDSADLRSYLEFTMETDAGLMLFIKDTFKVDPLFDE